MLAEYAYTQIQTSININIMGDHNHSKYSGPIIVVSKNREIYAGYHRSYLLWPPVIFIVESCNGLQPRTANKRHVTLIPSMY